MAAMNRERLELLRRRIGAVLEKRGALVLALFGVACLLLFAKTEKTPAPAQTQTPSFDLEKTRTELEAILSQIQGAGEVRLMLTLASGEENVYQTDTRKSTDSSGQTVQTSTVLRAEGASAKQALITMTQYPRYQGALVVCQGADRASVRLAVMEAVSSLTGLGSDRISVVKMKEQQEESS